MATSSRPADGCFLQTMMVRWFLMFPSESSVRQWQKPITGSWQRRVDMQLRGKRYRRSDIDAPNLAEHTIEDEVLCRQLEQVSCFGNRVLDGVNALPLVTSCGGLGISGSRIFHCSSFKSRAWHIPVWCLVVRHSRYNYFPSVLPNVARKHARDCLAVDRGIMSAI